MERLPGETLADRLREGPMPEPAVRAVAEDVLGALASAHDAGVVHRDIKPGNILLTEDGQAKIADFGIARESDTLLVEPTTTHALTGTPAYLAPERIDGQPATARSDIWAVGAVLYYALTGRKPYDGDSPLAVAMAVRDDERVPLREAMPDVDPALAATVERAMAAEPGRRYESAAAMAAALRGEDADTTLVDRTMIFPAPPPPAVATRVTARVMSRALVWWIVAAAVILLLIGIGIAAGRDANTSKQPNRTPASAQETTTVAPSTVPPTTVVVATPVQNEPVQAPVEVRRRGKKGRRD
jgi:serine/threonine-protein kinase